MGHRKRSLERSLRRKGQRERRKTMVGGRPRTDPREAMLPGGNNGPWSQVAACGTKTCSTIIDLVTREDMDERKESNSNDVSG